MTDVIVGIDLGTSTTVVAVADGDGTPRVLADEHGQKIFPSVVSFHPSGTVLVGADAKQRRVIDPHNTVYSVKRLIGRSVRSREIAAAAARVPYAIKEGANQQPVIATRAGEFAVPEISAIVLDHARNVARRALDQDVSHAVVTVPASFNDAQRSATATAGAIAGITVVRVLNEPTAAALAYGHTRQLNRIIAVYDFGGGTFDVTILRLEDQVYEVLGTAGDSFLGGDDLDERLVQHMVESFLASHRLDLREHPQAIFRLRAVAEQVKIELSRKSRALVKVDEIAHGPGGAAIDLEMEIAREHLIEIISDLVERTFPVCDEALRLADVAVSDIEDVVLVGGTTKIPHVRERVTRYFGQPPHLDVNPEEAVAIGASLQAASLARLFDGKKPASAGVPQSDSASRSRRVTDTRRPVERGATVDRIDGSYTTGQVPALTGQPLARMTRAASVAPMAAPRRGSDDETTAARPRRPPMVGAGSEARTTRTTGSLAAEPPPPVDPTAPEDPMLGAGLTAPPPPSSPDIAHRVRLTTSAPVAMNPRVLDVTPRSLGVGTVAGYCEELIRRNSQIPTEIKRLFTTSRDRQVSVRIPVCQGESRRLDENTTLGHLVLDNLEPRPRGETTIEVVFAIDASGILHVRARDSRTGREQTVHLAVIGAASPAEVVAAGERLRALRR